LEAAKGCRSAIKSFSETKGRATKDLAQTCIGGSSLSQTQSRQLRKGRYLEKYNQDSGLFICMKDILGK
jgi:hypothetical protein